VRFDGATEGSFNLFYRKLLQMKLLRALLGPRCTLGRLRSSLAGCGVTCARVHQLPDPPSSGP